MLVLLLLLVSFVLSIPFPRFTSTIAFFLSIFLLLCVFESVSVSTIFVSYT